MKSVKSLAVVVALIILCGVSLTAQESRAGWLRVEVTNTEGQPLRRACVTIVPREGDVLFRYADRDGKVKFKGLQPGSYRVVVRVDGYTAQKKEITINEGAETIAFSLQPRQL
jgi:hypothetical protein